MDSTIIKVNQEPYCIWETDIRERNLEFINGIDNDYFKYLFDVHNEKIETDDGKRASIALRTSYHHALETLYLLIGALVQAPDCVYAWISKCSTVELRDLVTRINKTDKSIFTKLNIDSVSWESIAKIVFYEYNPGTEINEAARKQFSKLWQRLSHSFLDDKDISEYNSLKHGFRVESGGFGLGGGIEPEHKKPPPANEMQTIGYSKHGSSFFLLEKVGGHSKKDRNYRSRRTSINWRIERVVLLLQLIACSIRNVTSALLVANGITDNRVQYNVPRDDDAFEKPWSYSTGVTSMNMDYELDESRIKPLTRDKLEELINKQLNRKS